MTYTEKYFAEFREQPNKGLGLFPWLFRVSFRYPNFSGTPTELKLYHDTPAKIAKSSGENSRFAFWHPQQLDLKIRAEESLNTDDFYVRTDRDVQVVVLYDTTGSGFNYSNVAFAGWLMPIELSERYGKKPYLLSVTAACGLSTLKDRPITDKLGKRLQGYVSVSTVLRTALYNTGLDLSLITGFNLFERYDLQVLAAAGLVAGKINSNPDPLYRTQIVAEALVSDSGETLSCYEALKKVCEPLRLRLGQANGKWICLNADEVIGGYDIWSTSNLPWVRVRTYSSEDLASAPDSESSESISLVQAVYPDQPVRVKNENPILRVLGIKPGVKVVQQFGRYLNYLQNGDWSSVDNTGLPTGFVRNNISAENAFRTGSGTEADPFALILYGAGDEKANGDTPSVRIKMEFNAGSPSNTQSFKRTLKCKFETNLIRAGKIVVIGLCDDRGANDSGEYLLTKGGEWKRFPSAKERLAILTYNANEEGTISFPGLAEINLPMNALSGLRELHVWFCVGEALSLPGGGPNLGTPDNRPWVKYYPATIETERVGVNLDSMQVVITDSKRKLDADATLTLGDVPFPLPYDRIGPFFRIDSHEPTIEWNKADAIGEVAGKALINWTAESVARQSMQKSTVIEAKLMGRLLFGLHTALRFSDIGRTPSAQPAIGAESLTITFQKAIFNFIYPEKYLPWIEVGMQISVGGFAGSNAQTYTVTGVSGLIKNPWWITVQETVTSQTITGATITDASTVPDATFKPDTFQVTSKYEWDLQACEVDIGAARIMDTDQESLPMPKGYWADKDGNLIPLSIDETNQPVNPALKTTLTDKEQFQRNLSAMGIKAKLGATTELAGYTAIPAGKAKLGADVLINGIKTGSLSAILRKYKSLINP